MIKFPNTDLQIFPLGLGGNTFGMTSSEAASQVVLDAFVARGGNFIDTADSYSAWVPGNKGGESETILGNWMQQRGNRSSVIIATKVAAHPQFMGLSPGNIARAADASLARLQTDYIDLYYAHHEDANVPIEQIAVAFDALVKAGKVRHVAVSNLPPERITAWMEFAGKEGLARPVALQPEYSLVARESYERINGPLAAKHGLAVFPYFALASGFLSGKYRTQADIDGAARGSLAGRYLNADGLRIIQALERIASSRDAAMSTVALAWVAAKPTVTAPLASATSVAQLEQLMAIAEFKLAPEEVAALDAASAAFA
ncbi:MAG: aldo/keto reductase [Nevskiaceae bacterium]|jgi:aryl-alcohol dehydrogenase-like predicted oxidoreductase|nr:aldo/keto reductase [Nevskiaceae bacterium]